jgi:hypothetical protein
MVFFSFSVQITNELVTYFHRTPRSQHSDHITNGCIPREHHPDHHSCCSYISSLFHSRFIFNSSHSPAASSARLCVIKRRWGPGAAGARTVVRAGVSVALGSSRALFCTQRGYRVSPSAMLPTFSARLCLGKASIKRQRPFKLTGCVRQIILSRGPGGLLDRDWIPRCGGIPAELGTEQRLSGARKYIRTCTTGSATIPIGWVRGVSPSPSPDPLSSSRKPGAAIWGGGTGTPNMGLPLGCYRAYSFLRTVTGVERGRDRQGRHGLALLGMGNCSGSLSRARTAIPSPSLSFCSHAMSWADLTYRCGLAHDQGNGAKSTVRHVLLLARVRACTWTWPLLRNLCCLVGHGCRDEQAHSNVTREIIDAASPIRQANSPKVLLNHQPPPCSFTSGPLDLHPSAEHGVLILLDPSANAQALDPNVLASGIR